MRAARYAAVALVLSGCATQGVTVRRLPPETPAADNAAAVKRAESVAAAMAAAAAQTPGEALTLAIASTVAPQASDAAPTPAIASTVAPQTSGAAPTPAVASTVAPQASGAAPTSPTAPPAAAPQTPAAPPGTASPASNPHPPEPPLTPEEAPSMYSWDPLERVNRFTYRFNARFDEHVFLPVANGYRRLPGALRAGVHNFFHNLAEVPSTANYILQLRLAGGARSVGRFVINTTLGIGGLFDVASRFKLSDEQTGFAATLSTWGVPPGPYLVIPILGPSTLRDGVGFLGDYGVDYGVNLLNLYRGYQSYPLGALNAVDQRARIDFRYYGSGSPFEYDTIRFLYVHRDLIQDEALRKVGRRKSPNTSEPAGK